MNKSDEIIEPPVDLFRRGETHHLLVDLPGISADDVRLWVDDRDVIVEAACHDVTASGDDLVLVERPTGRWRRRIRLPDDADPSTLVGDCTHGVLHIVASVGRPDEPPAAGRQHVEIGSGETLVAPADNKGASREN